MLRNNTYVVKCTLSTLIHVCVLDYLRSISCHVWMFLQTCISQVLLYLHCTCLLVRLNACILSPRPPIEYVRTSLLYCDKAYSIFVRVHNSLLLFWAALQAVTGFVVKHAWLCPFHPRLCSFHPRLCPFQRSYVPSTLSLPLTCQFLRPNDDVENLGKCLGKQTKFCNENKWSLT